MTSSCNHGCIIILVLLLKIAVLLKLLFLQARTSMVTVIEIPGDIYETSLVVKIHSVI